MVGGTIRRKVIHRESFRASVLHPSEIQAVLQSIAEKKCLLTTPSLLAESWPQLVTVSMVGGTIRRKVIHRESFRASVLHPSEIQAVLQSIAEKKSLVTTPALLAEAWSQLVTVSMVGGTIRRKVIHRESFRASVLHPSEIQAVLQSIAEKKCLLTTPSLLSRGTRRKNQKAKSKACPTRLNLRNALQ